MAVGEHVRFKAKPRRPTMLHGVYPWQLGDISVDRIPLRPGLLSPYVQPDCSRNFAKHSCNAVCKFYLLALPLSWKLQQKLFRRCAIRFERSYRGMWRTPEYGSAGRVCEKTCSFKAQDAQYVVRSLRTAVAGQLWGAMLRRLLRMVLNSQCS